MYFIFLFSILLQIGHSFFSLLRSTLIHWKKPKLLVLFSLLVGSDRIWWKNSCLLHFRSKENWYLSMKPELIKKKVVFFIYKKNCICINTCSIFLFLHSFFSGLQFYGWSEIVKQLYCISKMYPLSHIMSFLKIHCEFQLFN